MIDISELKEIHPVVCYSPKKTDEPSPCPINFCSHFQLGFISDSLLFASAAAFSFSASL